MTLRLKSLFEPLLERIVEQRKNRYPPEYPKDWWPRLEQQVQNCMKTIEIGGQALQKWCLKLPKDEQLAFTDEFTTPYKDLGKTRAFVNTTSDETMPDANVPGIPKKVSNAASDEPMTDAPAAVPSIESPSTFVFKQPTVPASAYPSNPFEFMLWRGGPSGTSSPERPSSRRSTSSMYRSTAYPSSSTTAYASETSDSETDTPANTASSNPFPPLQLLARLASDRENLETRVEPFHRAVQYQKQHLELQKQAKLSGAKESAKSDASSSSGSLRGLQPSDRLINRDSDVRERPTVATTDDVTKPKEKESQSKKSKSKGGQGK